MKQIFLVQGLMGLTSEELKSQLFVINRNTIKNPILVLPVYDLLFNEKRNFQGEFIKNFTPIISSSRNEENFFNFMRTATLSIKTHLKITQLASLYKNINT